MELKHRHEGGRSETDPHRSGNGIWREGEYRCRYSSRRGVHGRSQLVRIELKGVVGFEAMFVVATLLPFFLQFLSI